MTIRVIEKLLLGKTPRQIHEEHGIDFGFYGSKVSLNYNQIESKSSDALASECRGIVICNKDAKPLEFDSPITDPIILARPFPRFFNLGDPNAYSQNIHMDDLAYVKYDGTLIIVYYDDVVRKEWCVATRSVPEANQRINHDFYNGSFRDLFEQILRTKGIPFDELTQRLSVKHTYAFELVSEYNKQVCEYPKPDIFLLACIETQTGEEYLIETLDFPTEIEKAKTIPIENHEKMIEYIESLPPSESEGIVLVKRDGDKILGRIKIKSTDYKNAHGMKSSIESSKRNIVSLVLNEKWDDVRSLAGAKALEFGDSVGAKITEKAKEIEDVIERSIKLGNGDRKATALAAKEINSNYITFVMMKFDNKWSGYLNYIKSSKKNGLDYPDKTLDSIIAYCN